MRANPLTLPSANSNLGRCLMPLLPGIPSLVSSCSQQLPESFWVETRLSSHVIPGCFYRFGVAASHSSHVIPSRCHLAVGRPLSGLTASWTSYWSFSWLRAKVDAWFSLAAGVSRECVNTRSGSRTQFQRSIVVRIVTFQYLGFDPQCVSIS